MTDFQTIRVSFPNSKGDFLSGSLEMPPSQSPRLFAIFSHCFTCSSNYKIAANVSKKLAELNIATLRFDFTGLGSSGGNFAETNFSSNVSDILSAVNFLGENYELPQLLIGHSMGGSATLQAAAAIPSARCVVTIAAPSTLQHLQDRFRETRQQIEHSGEGELQVAGRSFKIRRMFFDDIAQLDLSMAIKRLNQPLLILHSSTDEVVPFRHAEQILSAAPQPASLIDLNPMDHLISEKEDGFFIGELIHLWASRYIHS